MKIIKLIFVFFRKENVEEKAKKSELPKNLVRNFTADNSLVDNSMYRIVDDFGNNHKCTRCQSEVFNRVLTLGLWTHMQCSNCKQRFVLGEGAIKAQPKPLFQTAIS